jgi:hypothetical protein
LHVVQPQGAESMRNLVFTGAILAGLVASGTLITSGVQAATGSSGSIGAAADRLGIVEETQFVYEGRRHCWYPDGWHGPGWYWCGYNWRRGLGWGGPAGWHGWRWREEHREERREERRERRWDRY